jgi:hypothetical protein
MKANELGRRGVIQGGLATLALSSAAGAAQAMGKPLDPADPRDVARMYRKLAFSMDGRPGFWWLVGR